MEKILAFALLASASTGPVIYGPGVDSCGEWLEARRVDGPVRLTMHAWLAGYLSAINAAAGHDMLKIDRQEDARLWLDQWCRAHPTQSVSRAAERFVIEASGR